MSTSSDLKPLLKMWVFQKQNRYFFYYYTKIMAFEKSSEFLSASRIFLIFLIVWIRIRIRNTDPNPQNG